MTRLTFLSVSLLVLWSLVGCTPAGAPPRDDSFSLEPSGQAPAADAPAAPESPPPESPAARAPAAEPKSASDAGRTIVLGEKLALTAPEHWAPKPPAMQMIAYEFAVPPAEGDEESGRMTVMTAGGSVEANIERWIGQFSQPDGAETKDRAKVEKKTIGGQEVHLVDVAGTYQDARGPFAPAVARPDYRMLAAILPTPEGTYFLKFYGPKKTVGENQAAFEKMIEGMK